MALDYDKLMACRAKDVPVAWTDRETLLYALAVGFGQDPVDEGELAYVCEHGSLRTVPTFSTVLRADGFAGYLDESGWDFSRVLHGEQRLALHRPLPPAGELLLDSRVTAAYDKGEGRGAIILTETEGRLARDDTALFTLGNTLFARGDGGFGGPPGSGPSPHPEPGREPDLACELATRPEQALLYRLNGDRNPLHADPAAAARAGFDRPILHGLCTYGFACHAVLKTVCEYDHTLITGFDARFSAPVFPGERIVTEMWQDGNVVAFRCRVPERDVTVVSNGRCTLSL
jgi:acyl dehydratase